MQHFEDKYADVLQNIEHAIVSVYRENENLLDYEADKAIDALLRAYKLEGSPRPYVKPKMSELSDLVYGRVKTMCDWRMGRDDVQTEIVLSDTKTVDEIMACLKRIRKSIKTWTKEGGRQGYVQFISQYVF